MAQKCQKKINTFLLLLNNRYSIYIKKLLILLSTYLQVCFKIIFPRCRFVFVYLGSLRKKNLNNLHYQYKKKLKHLLLIFYCSLDCRYDASGHFTSSPLNYIFFFQILCHTTTQAIKRCMKLCCRGLKFCLWH